MYKKYQNNKQNWLKWYQKDYQIENDREVHIAC